MIVRQDSKAYRKVHFAVMAIEASAKKARTSGKAMHDRLKAQGLIHERLFRYYDQLHTQSQEWVASDTLETLRNWEKEQQQQSRPWGNCATRK